MQMHRNDNPAQFTGGPLFAHNLQAMGVAGWVTSGGILATAAVNIYNQAFEFFCDACGVDGNTSGDAMNFTNVSAIFLVNNWIKTLAASSASALTFNSTILVTVTGGFIQSGASQAPIQFLNNASDIRIDNATISNPNFPIAVHADSSVKSGNSIAGSGYGALLPCDNYATCGFGPLTTSFTTVAALPSATTFTGGIMSVDDSTAIFKEGQTCVGGSNHVALAFASSGTWKCF
jgi:hypothetical protein